MNLIGFYELNKKDRFDRATYQTYSTYITHKKKGLSNKFVATAPFSWKLYNKRVFKAFEMQKTPC